VKPEILGRGDLEGEEVVLLVASADQHLEPVDDDGAVGSALARHGRPRV
jgi:hypothetical protein